MVVLEHGCGIPPCASQLVPSCTGQIVISPASATHSILLYYIGLSLSFIRIHERFSTTRPNYGRSIRRLDWAWVELGVPIAWNAGAKWTDDDGSRVMYVFDTIAAMSLHTYTDIKDRV